MDRPLFRRVDTVFLPVRDLDKAVAWYTEHLGLTLRWQHGNYAALNVAETPLTLYQPEGEYRPIKEHMPFNFYSPDIEAARERLRAAGAAVGEINRHENFAHFACTDPDGNQLGVCWFPE